MEKHVMQYQTVHFNLNGKDVERTVDVRASLTDMLRNDFRMTSVKKGCEVGECGACNVLIDGECYNSCLYLAVWAEGKHITTLRASWAPTASCPTFSRPSWRKPPSSAASASRALS